MPRIIRTHHILIGMAIALCVSGVCATSPGPDRFDDDKSPECLFLAGAWEGYFAGLTAIPPLPSTKPKSTCQKAKFYP